MADTTHLEERIAHLLRTVDDLSAIVARQADEIDLLTRRVRFLIEREAEREADAFAPADPNQRPPHW